MATSSTDWPAVAKGGVMGAALMLLAVWFTPLGVLIKPAPTSSTTTAPLVASPAATEPTVYVTNTGTKYHRAGCRHLKSSIAMPLSRASKQYEPCKVCSPPR